jgi:endonuclease YncB( thermonuclease family)
MIADLPPAIICEAPKATDGDTLSCRNGDKIRMTGIDTPELKGHCRKGRVCVPGDPFKSKANLERGFTLGPVTYRVIKKDLYGRNVALVYGGLVNLSCLQLKSGGAIYKPTWDTGKHIARECGVK